jgi:predicted regulator of Ras-like GTPase activity (Roadblock/LC7/MglB family)
MGDSGASSVFQAELEKVLLRIPGALSATLVDVDGIALASYSADNTLNADVVAAELATMAKGMKRVFDALRTGGLQEFMFTTDRAVIVTRSVGTEFFLYIVLKDERSLGLSRVETKRLSKDLEKALLL